MQVAVAFSPSAVELIASSVRMRERVEREHDQDEEMKTHPDHLEFELVVEWLERSLRHLFNEAKQNHSRSKRKHSRCEKQLTSKTKTAPLVQGIDGIEKLDCDLCRYAIASGPILT